MDEHLEFMDRTVNCFNEIRHIIDVEGFIRIDEIEVKAIECGSLTTRVLDMLNGFDYSIDYTNGIVTK